MAAALTTYARLLPKLVNRPGRECKPCTAHLAAPRRGPTLQTPAPPPPAGAAAPAAQRTSRRRPAPAARAWSCPRPAARHPWSGRTRQRRCQWQPPPAQRAAGAGGRSECVAGVTQAERQAAHWPYPASSGAPPAESRRSGTARCSRCGTASARGAVLALPPAWARASSQTRASPAAAPAGPRCCGPMTTAGPARQAV